MDKKPLLKGKLTKLGVAIMASSELPEVLSNLTDYGVTLSETANAPLSAVKLVGAVVTIWGAIRKACNYFGK